MTLTWQAPSCQEWLSWLCSRLWFITILMQKDLQGTSEQAAAAHYTASGSLRCPMTLLYSMSTVLVAIVLTVHYS